jgi:probable HAF family extracellular repeat protein
MRLSIRRHLKYISNNIDKDSEKQKLFAIAQIHATILTIFIAIFSTAAIYYINILKEKEMVVSNDALRINNLNFVISYVTPSSAFPFPKDADDSVELASSILYLSDCVYYNDRHEVVTFKDVIQRAKKIYCIMNVVSHRYPFPEYPIERGNIFRKFNYIRFENLEHIRKWCKDLQKVCRALYFAVEMVAGRPQIGDALIKNDDYLKRWRGLKSFQDAFGLTDLHYVERDFIIKLKQALEISNLVEHSLRDYDRFKKELPNNLTILLAILFAIIAFICGVIYPIASQKPRSKVYKLIPILFYILVITYFLFEIFTHHSELSSFNLRLPFFQVKQASFMKLGDLPGGRYSSKAKGISSDGSVVVGSSISSAGMEGFSWSKSTGMTGIGDLSGGSFSSIAMGVSGNGSVMVGYSSSALGTEAFRWISGNDILGLGDLPGDPFRSEALSISTDGSLIVGRSWITGSDQKAFLWSEADGMVDLGDLPGGGNVSEAHGISGDGSVIVGWSASKNRLEAFRWTKSTGMVGLGGFVGGADNLVNADSRAYNISADGSTIVGAAGVCSKAFRWTEEEGMVAISNCGGRANAASYDGSIVVGQVVLLGEQKAIIWDKINGTRYLEEVLTNEFDIDLMGFKLKEACDISDDGSVIVGCGINSQGSEEAWIVKFLRTL